MYERLLAVPATVFENSVEVRCRNSSSPRSIGVNDPVENLMLYRPPISNIARFLILVSVLSERWRERAIPHTSRGRR